MNASDYTNDEGPQSSTIATIGLATGEDFIGKFSMTGTWPSDVVSYDDEVTRPLELLCAGDLGLGLVAYYYVDGETNDVYPTKDQLVIPKASGNTLALGTRNERQEGVRQAVQVMAGSRALLAPCGLQSAMPAAGALVVSPPCNPGPPKCAPP